MTWRKIVLHIIQKHSFGGKNDTKEGQKPIFLVLAFSLLPSSPSLPLSLHPILPSCLSFSPRVGLGLQTKYFKQRVPQVNC